MKKGYVIQVAPLIPLPVLRTQIFSYWHSNSLAVGSLVRIPFYFREVQGIVLSSYESSRDPKLLKLKSIRKVISKEKLLSENQLRLAHEIARYYFAPLGSILRLMVPKVARMRIKKMKEDKKRIRIGEPGKTALKIIRSNKNKFLLIGSAKEREKINNDLIQYYLSKNKQCLILVPEVFSSYGVWMELRKNFSDEIALVHGRIAKGQFYDYWQKIKAGKIKIIVASKIGIFLPFMNLKIVIVQEEQDVSFKQQEAIPRYSAVKGAEFLADISDAKLVLESSLPSVENFYRTEKKNLEMIDLKSCEQRFPKLEIITPDYGKRNPDFPISEVLHKHLENIVRNKEQAVIFVNRRGFSTRTICENCKKILKCPKCEKPLLYSDEGGFYRCLHCAYKADILSICPSCGGFQFTHHGIGTHAVEKKIKTLFPSLAVSRLDADTMRSSLKYKNILQKFSSGEIKVIVGTQSVIKGIYSRNVRLVAAISDRDFKDGVEFNSRGFALSRLFYVAGLVNKDGILAIQSFTERNSIFDFYKRCDLEEYYRTELEMRRRFCYPPFRKLIKLTYHGKSNKETKMETEKIFDLLQDVSDNKSEVIGPYTPLVSPKKGLYNGFIIIKLDPGKNIQDLPICSLLGELRKSWSIDVDPMNLF